MLWMCCRAPGTQRCMRACLSFTLLGTCGVQRGPAGHLAKEALAVRSMGA